MKIKKRGQFYNTLSVECGNTTDDFEYLRKVCKKEAEKLLASMDFSSESTISVAFWTCDYPELICVGNFCKEEGGSINYDLDFSQATL